ncbi:hypothetical protein DFH06DRAFT_1320715 [Mycena polygramma]|nr:hypothetical protein DFH06DRAFT_1320715 [Mycena polygramma]
MDPLNDLVLAASQLNLGFHCCDRCCKPRFVFRHGDPSEAELSAASKHKFYIVKKGAPNSEAIYTHWDSAKIHVLGISGALHESCPTADGAREIWARYCHENHHHHVPPPPPQPSSSSRPPRAATAVPRTAPPPYSPMTPPSSPRARQPATPTRPRPNVAATPERPTPARFYRVSGSPRVLINSRDAERELRAARNGSLLVGDSLSDVEDDDEPSVVGAVRFYRVFGSTRVQSNRDAALSELVETAAAGLLVGDTLDEVTP